MTAVLIKRGDLDRGRHMQREGGVKILSEKVALGLGRCTCKPGNAVDCWQPPAARRGKGESSPRAIREECGPAGTTVSDL